jgi:hypothetical protein
MRNLWIVGLIGAGSLTACDQAYDPDAPAIDPNAPRVHITSPARGTFAGDVKLVTVTGTALDDTGVNSVTVNGVPATLDAAGAFTAVVPVIAGTNLLHAVAKDAQGNAGKETRAVVAGPLEPIANTVPQAITASLSSQTFDAIGRGLTGYVTTANLTAVVTPANPVVNIGAPNGPDCLYGQAHITGLHVGNHSTITLTPQPGGLYLDAELDAVSVGMHLQWAVSCLDGSRDVTVGASHIRVAGMLTVGVNHGVFDIHLDNPDVVVTGFDVNLGGIPGSVIDMLSLDTRLGPIIGWAVERFATPVVNNALAGLNETKTIDVLGAMVDINVTPERIDFDVTGAIVELDTKLRARGDTASPGFVYVANEVPAMDTSHGFELAVADDAVNQLFGSLWAAKVMDKALDLQTGSYGEIGQLYDRVELSAKVPPFVDARDKKLKLTIGDLMATFKHDAAIATQVVINAEVAMKVTANTDGSLRLDVGTPTTYIDILDENVDGANQLSNAQFEAVTSFGLSRIVAFGSGAAGAIPLPAFGGVTVRNVSINEQTGYVVVAGEVE